MPGSTIEWSYRSSSRLWPALSSSTPKARGTSRWGAGVACVSRPRAEILLYGWERTVYNEKKLNVIEILFSEKARGWGGVSIWNVRSRHYSSKLFTSVVDPDLHWFWSAVFGSGSRRAKNPQKRGEISCFEVLDVLFWWLKASPVARTSFTEA